MSVGIVIIGRNEGERLRRCLESVRMLPYPVVYVDSASSDGSADVAKSFGVAVIELDERSPLSAARARNEGFRQLLEDHPALSAVQFLDSDCTLHPGWIPAALPALTAEPKRAVVAGQVFERDVAASAYNRLCALEWRSAPGDLQSYGHLGGIFLARVDVFRSLGGFRPEVIAGEDSELGVRMALAGYKVTKLDVPMAMHDAGMTSFRQWWRRAVRAGHAIGQRAHLHGRSPVRDCARERASTLFWGIGLPAAVLLTALPTRGLSLVLLLGYAALGLRIWRFRRRTGDSAADALLYAVFALIGKFANAVGLMIFALRRPARRYDIIEYK